MNLTETATLIIWINQFDYHVQFNDAARDIWHHSMAPITVDEAEEAVMQHYRANPGVKAEPGAILKRALQIRNSRDASQRAIEPPKPKYPKHPSSWRSRNPELWDQLFEQGRAEGNAQRQRATDELQAAA